MAGHSKWANIKHRKGRADALRGKIFTRAAKEIISAVKVGGGDPKMNTRLRLAILKARAANVPNEIIERNIKKGTSTDQSDYTSVTYELYGHGGVGLIVEGLTDNKNRFASDMRIATNKRGGTIAMPGAVLFNFDQKGVIQIPKRTLNESDVFAAAIEAGAEDFEVTDDAFMLTTAPEELFAVKEALQKADVTCERADSEMIPKAFVECDIETSKSNLALIEWIENLDDVDSVYHNMRIPEEL